MAQSLGENKKQQVIIMMSPTDKQRLQDAAYAEELTVSEYARGLLKEALPPLKRKRRV